MNRMRLDCPHCGKHNDAHSGATPDEVPKDGDVSVCVGCVGLAMFVVDRRGTSLRLPTAEEEHELNLDPYISLARAGLMLAKLGQV